MTENPPQQLSNAIFTVPNILSFIRLALVPVFIYLLIEGHDLWALLVLIFASLSDYADGWIARKFNLITRLGQLLDPAADRLYIFAALIGLAYRDFVPWWLVAIIIGRDVSLVFCSIWLANIGYGPLPVHHLGKAATFALFYALPLLMLGKALPEVAFISDPIGWAAVLWGALLYWWAGIIYWRETARLAKEVGNNRSQKSSRLDG